LVRRNRPVTWLACGCGYSIVGRIDPLLNRSIANQPRDHHAMRSLSFPGLNRLPQWLATVLVALVLSLLTFAASFAEVPYSEFQPSVTATP
jgi:hypothetical protein